MENKDILMKLKNKISSGKAIFATTTSAGLLVKKASEMSLDFVVVHKESLFGIDGRLPLLARVGYGGNCNQIMLDNSENLLRFSGDMPIIAGIGVAEPYYNVDMIAEKILEKGYSGLTHIPSSGGWIGDFGHSISKAGCGYEAEVEFIRRWSRKGIFTVGYCFEEEQVKMMSDAGAGVIAIYTNKIENESQGWDNVPSEEVALIKATKLVEIARKENPSAIILITAGNSTKFEFVQDLICNTKADGYLGDERIESSLVYHAVFNSVNNVKKLYGV